MAQELNRVLFLEVVEKEVAEHHVVLSVEGSPDRILPKTVEGQIEGPSSLASLVQCDFADITSMQVQVDSRPTGAEAQTQWNVSGAGGDVQYIE